MNVVDGKNWTISILAYILLFVFVISQAIPLYNYFFESNKKVACINEDPIYQRDIYDFSINSYNDDPLANAYIKKLLYKDAQYQKIKTFNIIPRVLYSSDIGEYINDSIIANNYNLILKEQDIFYTLCNLKALDYLSIKERLIFAPSSLVIKFSIIPTQDITCTDKEVEQYYQLNKDKYFNIENKTKIVKKSKSDIQDIYFNNLSSFYYPETRSGVIFYNNSSKIVENVTAKDDLSLFTLKYIGQVKFFPQGYIQLNKINPAERMSFDQAIKTDKFLSLLNAESIKMEGEEFLVNVIAESKKVKYFNFNAVKSDLINYKKHIQAIKLAKEVKSLDLQLPICNFFNQSEIFAISSVEQKDYYIITNNYFSYVFKILYLQNTNDNIKSYDKDSLLLDNEYIYFLINKS